MTWWWLSFADGRRARGDQFLGGVYVRADNMIAAVNAAHRLGINPGGEVQGVDLDHVPPADAQNRLLSKDDMERLGLGVERWPR